MTISPSTVRANGESLRGYIAIFRGAQVLEATIDNDAAALSETSLDITITSGSIAAVQRGYRVQFFSSIGEFKGETHVRWGSTLDATHLPVREFSQSEYLIKALDIVRVFALIAFDDKLVESTDTFDPDGVPVGTYNSLPPPLAASGGYDAGFVDGYETGTPLTYRTQTTNGAPSLILDPTSTPGNLSHLWTLPTGVTFAPGSASTDVSPTLRVTVGEYTVYHDVTDNDNAQTWRQCVTYQCFDAAHPPVSCIMETVPTGDPTQGWSCTFRAVDFLTLTDAPDGSLCLFFVRERINGSWQSLGGTEGRAPVKLLGYLSHDESDLTPQLQYQRFEVISPLTRLSQLPGFSRILIQNETPDDWSEMLQLTTLRAMIQLIRIYTFALDGGHDLLTGTYLLDVPYPELWLQKESARQQVDELADGVDARFTCTRTGLFRLDPVLAMLDLPYRAVSSVAYTFQRQDVARLVARRSHFDTVETLELHATSGTNTGDTDDALPYFSRAPGSPGHGADFITIERIIATANNPQDDANARAGRRYAWRNGVFTSSNTGIKGRAPEIDVEMREVYDFLDFDDQIVRFGSFPNPRDVDLTFFDWSLSAVRLDYASGKVISTFQALTDSPPGATYIPPGSSIVIPAPPPVVYPPTQTPGGTLTYSNNIASVTYGNFLVRTADFKSTSPTWTAINLAGAPYNMLGDVLDFVPDAFSPLYLGTGTTVNGWILTTTHVYRVTDIFGTVAITSQTSFTAVSSGAIQMERATPGLVIAVTHTAGGVSTSRYTTDGVTWAAATGVPATTDGFAQAPTIYIDPHGSGIYAIFFSGAGVSAAYSFNPSTGAFTAVSSPNLAIGDVLGTFLTTAYAVPNVFYVDSETAILKVSGATQTDISPVYSAASFPEGGGGIRFLRVDDNNPLKAAISARTSRFTTDVGLWIATAGVSSPASWTNVIVPSGANYGIVANLSIVYPILFIYGEVHIEIMDMDSLVRSDKTGNLVGVGALVNLCGGGGN